MTEPLFELGQVVMTRTAQRARDKLVQLHIVQTKLNRHATGE